MVDQQKEGVDLPTTSCSLSLTLVITHFVSSTIFHVEGMTE